MAAGYFYSISGSFTGGGGDITGDGWQRYIKGFIVVKIKKKSKYCLQKYEKRKTWEIKWNLNKLC